MSSEDSEKRDKIDLTDKTPEEILALASERGLELTDEQLDEVSGGSWSGGECVYCGSSNISMATDQAFIIYWCKDCGNTWVE